MKTLNMVSFNKYYLFLVQACPLTTIKQAYHALPINYSHASDLRSFSYTVLFLIFFFVKSCHFLSYNAASELFNNES